MTTIDVSTIPRIGHDEAMRITEVENARFSDLLARCSPDEWAARTECELWDVRAMAAHIVGSAAGQVSPREFVRQVRAGRPITEELGAPNWWDGMNELQVRERASLTTDELVAEWEAVWPKALRSRTKLPRLVARLPLLKLPPPVGRQPVSYLFDMGFTRDVWMHRVDICHATGLDPCFDADHDGRIVADIVAEWAVTHGEPFTLVLDGPAGGTFVSGDGGERVEASIVDFARTLTERLPADGVLRHPLPL